MVIDDSKIVIDRLVPSLEELPNVAAVVYGTTYEDAERLLQEIKIDVAVIDIILPGKSGIDLLRSMKEKNMLVKVLVVMMTDAPSESKRELCLSLGADYFIDKFEGFERITDIIANYSWHGSIKKEDRHSSSDDDDNPSGKRSA